MSELIESLKKCKVEGNTLFLPPISEGMLPNYKEVRQALINAGAKYNKNKFVFGSDAQPFIDRLCGGEVVNIRKSFQAFYTPKEVADFVIGLAEIKSTHSVLEPSGGEGALIKAVHKLFPKLSVYYCELMPENRQILNIINHTKIIFEDFLKIHNHYFDYFDRIVANPPFSKNQDCLHVRKMYECPKPGGRLVSIMSNHWRQSDRKKEAEFKNWFEEVKGEIHEIEAGKFKESGTMISCCIVIINKTK